MAEPIQLAESAKEARRQEERLGKEPKPVQEPVRVEEEVVPASGLWRKRRKKK